MPVALLADDIERELLLDTATDYLLGLTLSA